MFLDIPDAIKERLQQLEQIDARDRTDGTPRLKRLCQIPPETGKFIALLAATAPGGKYIEIGTSAGYSTLWLALACRATGRRITTFELLPEKVRLEQETVEVTNTSDVIEIVVGDARDYLPDLDDISFCFLDAEKELYHDCYEMVMQRLVPGGLLIADNAISHQHDLQPMLERALADNRTDALVVPVGKGELICRKL